MRNPLAVLAFAAVALASPSTARAMCGAMLVKLPPRPPPGVVAASARITNQATKVVLVRDGDKTVVTMSNDFDGDVLEFGLVVPVPSVVTKADVKLLEARVFDALEAATAPTLEEHWDPSPCPAPPMAAAAPPAEAKAEAADAAPARAKRALRASDYGVKVESHFAAGEYDVAVLSGKDSSRLIDWLRLFKYDVPKSAEDVIRSYLAQKTYFLVAHVDVRKMQREGRAFLRPLQVTTKSPKFMLPIRLGMVNAAGPQELVVYALSPEGRVEPTNYRSVRLATGKHLPPSTKDRFRDVQRAAFEHETNVNGMRVVFSEWNGAADENLDPTSIAEAGVPATRPNGWWLSRLHFLYDAERFPEDLVLQTTADRARFAVRHHVTHPWTGPRDACPEAAAYFDRVAARREEEAATLASFTGWPMQRARAEAGLPATPPTTTTKPTPPPKEPWYRRIWGD